MTEVFEDASVAPGQLFLFGRVPVGSRTESVCVVVGNISRHLFFLPAEREGGRCSVAEVKQEVLDILSPLVKNTREIGFRVDRKKYAFEIEGIPTEEVPGAWARLRVDGLCPFGVPWTLPRVPAGEWPHVPARVRAHHFVRTADRSHA